MMLQYIPSGDSAFIIKAGNEISPDLHRIVRKLLIKIENEHLEGVIDFIPTYNELMVCYDPSVIAYKDLLIKLKSFESVTDNTEFPDIQVIQVPVLYGGESGPDLSEVAYFNSISKEDVIRIHSSETYLVYMLGFTPGFCYLGGLDQRIATPRKITPRVKIPAGAIGIADTQTGIYSIESPGGWQWIGKTPLRLFDPGRKPEFLFQSGDYIQFYPISEDKFEDILRELKAGIFQLKKNRRV